MLKQMHLESKKVIWKTRNEWPIIVLLNKQKNLVEEQNWKTGEKDTEGLEHKIVKYSWLSVKKTWSDWEKG